VAKKSKIVKNEQRKVLVARHAGRWAAPRRAPRCLEGKLVIDVALLGSA